MPGLSRHIPVSYPDHRLDMLAAAKEFFGRSVEMEDRVFRSLVTIDPEASRSPKDMAIWRSLYQTVPAIQELYSRIDIRMDTAPPTKNVWDPRSSPSGLPDWGKTFRSIFVLHTRHTHQTFPPIGELVPAAREVRLDGQLTVERVALGILQSGSQYMVPVKGRRKVRTVRTNNNVVASILQERGLPPDAVSMWGPRSEIFTVAAAHWLRNAFKGDESFGSQQFLLYFEGSTVRIRPFGYTGVHRIEQGPLKEGSVWVARSNMLEPLELFDETAIYELELLVNSDAPEREFQQFFDANRSLLPSLGPWKRAHSQLILQRDEGGPLVPDIFLERLDSDFCDLLDLKLPTADLIRRQRNRVRFKDCVMEGVAQLRQYRDWFEDSTHRAKFRSRYNGLDAYRPKAVIVIGRRSSYFDGVERVRLESDLPEWLQLCTYDDILSNARRWHAKVGYP
jgi:hypothetical protein